MTNAIELRKAFAAFLGEDRSRKFVATGWPLRFWQEQEWRRFCSARPEVTAGLDLLEVATRVCELHGEALQSDEAELFHGCLDYATEYIRTRNRLFPHAANDPVSAEGAAVQKTDRVTVWYCPGCRAAKQTGSALREQRHQVRRPKPPA